MSGGSYPVGNVIRLSGTFTDLAGALIDPTAVTLQLRDPEGNITDYVDPDVVHASTGRYYYDLDADVIGEWDYRWFSVGTGQAAAEDSFIVEYSEFIP